MFTYNPTLSFYMKYQEKANIDQELSEAGAMDEEGLKSRPKYFFWMIKMF